ncbi:hypothetical protein P7C70_g3919, partial [Phenoliferia sp. Uapishka_3]
MSRPPFKQVEASRVPFGRDEACETTKTPNPDWSLGGGANNLKWPKVSDSTWTAIDPASTPAGNIYKLLISGITPRPIALLSSCDAEGVTNLAPFSYFNIVSHNPPTIVISFTNGNPPAKKESAANILATKEFTVSIISEALVEAANSTSIDAPPEISEWGISGLTPIPSNVVRPPRVGESAFSMECTLEHSHDLNNDAGECTATVVIGRIRMIHARDDVYDPETSVVDLEKLKPISRLGGITYARTTKTFELPRPQWSATKDTAEMNEALERGKAASRIPIV